MKKILVLFLSSILFACGGFGFAVEVIDLPDAVTAGNGGGPGEVDSDFEESAENDDRPAGYVVTGEGSVMTDFEKQAMEDITFFRWKLNLSESCDDAVAAIDEYSAMVNAPEYAARVGEEILLSMNNILVWEKYNYLYEKDIAHPDLEPLIKGQYKTVKKFFKEHRKAEHNKWLYTTSGDILSCCMQFLPLATAMHEGLTIKKYYDDGLEQDPDMVFCLINIGQWYFYAPGMNGGGKKKAMRTFEHAVKSAENDAELFYARILLSQSMFEDKQFEKAAALLDEAEKLLPGARNAAFYRRINAIGHSYFDYTVHRKKVDAKLAKRCK